ncbi:collectrin [Bos mutus]|uniref:collectrin n=1 Tax=Bos mutus TaxID=72004 RepID=UPI0038B681FD
MLWLLFFLVTAIRADLCRPDAENAFKVRLSIRTALGDKAYAWDANEEYLFKAMVAFSMRKVPNRETTEATLLVSLYPLPSLFPLRGEMTGLI